MKLAAILVIVISVLKCLIASFLVVNYEAAFGWATATVWTTIALNQYVLINKLMSNLKQVTGQ